jgi:hypothetical protein
MDAPLARLEREITKKKIKFTSVQQQKYGHDHQAKSSTGSVPNLRALIRLNKSARQLLTKTLSKAKRMPNRENP